MPVLKVVTATTRESRALVRGVTGSMKRDPKSLQAAFVGVDRCARVIHD